MKPNRTFRPEFPAPLEGRVVLSNASVPAALAAQVAASKAASQSFPLSQAATLRAGLPVKTQINTTYADGTTRTETRLVVPNASNGTTTTYESIKTRAGQALSTVDISSKTGDITTQSLTSYMPGGVVTTMAVTDVKKLGKTLIRATEYAGGGSLAKNISGTLVNGASRTTLDTMTTSADGTVERDHTVDHHYGDTFQTTVTTATLPGGARQVTRSTTTIERLPTS